MNPPAQHLRTTRKPGCLKLAGPRAVPARSAQKHARGFGKPSHPRVVGAAASRDGSRSDLSGGPRRVPVTWQDCAWQARVIVRPGPSLALNRGGDGSSPNPASPSFRLGTSRPHPDSGAQSASTCWGFLSPVAAGRALRILICVSQLPHHASRITHHVSRFTHPAFR